MQADRLVRAATVAVALLLGAATVVVYQTPQDGTSSTGQTLAGETVFRTKGCVGCHAASGINEGTGAGPDLSSLADRAADRVAGLGAVDYVRQSVLQPQAFIVPGFELGVQMPTLPLAPAEVDALVEFLLER